MAKYMFMLNICHLPNAETYIFKANYKNTIIKEKQDLLMNSFSNQTCLKTSPKWFCQISNLVNKLELYRNYIYKHYMNHWIKFLLTEEQTG